MSEESINFRNPNDNQYKLSVMTGEDAFHQLREEWEDLWVHSPDATQFQRWEWQYFYYKHRVPHGRLKILTARDAEGKCVALAAFCTVADVDSGFPRTTFLGDSSADYHMILCHPNLPQTIGFETLDHIFKTSGRRAPILDLNNIPEGSWTEAVISSYLKDISFSRDLLVQRQTQIYSVPLPGDLETYIKQLGSRSRKDFSYDRRRLEREFAVTWKIFTGVEDLEQCLAGIESINRVRWQLDSNYRDSDRREFLVSLARAQAKAGIYLAYILYLNDIPAAYVAGAVVKNSYKVESISHDPNIARHLSVGKTMNFYAIEDCIRRGFSEYDLTRGSETYKKWLGAEPRNNFHVRLYRSRLDRGLVLAGEKSLGFLRNQTWLRRIYQRFVRGVVE